MDYSSLQGDGGWDRLTRHEVPIAENVWAAPESYAGYLWFLTESGQLCRYSPFDRRYSEQFAFGPGAACSTLVIRELPRAPHGQRPPVMEPFAMALTPTSLTAFGLISRTKIELNTPASDEYFLNDAVQDYHCLATTEGAVWCLAETSRDGISLVRADPASGQCQEWALGVSRAVGPVAAGGAVAVWGEAELLVFDKGQIRRSPFPEGFSPFLTSAEAGDLRGGLGRRPGVVCRADLYVPGLFRAKPAFANFHISDGMVGAVATLPLAGPASYSQDHESCLLVVCDGSLDRFEQVNPKAIWRDRQLRSDRLPFSEGGLQVGFVDIAGGELLRMRGSRGPSDTNLPSGPRVLDTHGFQVAGSALLCTYNSAGGAGVISWHA